MTPSKQSLPVWAALLGSGLAGTLVALQSQVNGGLSQELGNGYVTAAVSFGSGFVIMVLAVVVSARGRRGIHKLRAELASKHLPVWALTGGLCGAFFVLGQGLVAPLLGLALFTVGIVGGQVLGGLVIDKVGLGPGGKVRPSPQRIVGTVLAIVAVVLSVLADLSAPGGESPKLWLVLIPVAAGLAIAWQSAVNGLVRSASQSATAATFVNFLVGTAVLVLAASVSVGLQGWPQTWPSEPWYYVGGFVGTIFIGVAAMLVRAAGVLLLSMSNVAGQLIASVAFDAGIPLAGGVTPGLLAGAAVALLAVTIAALPRRSTRG
ncbi:DMT family transporter [Leucobacter sp. Z1108]|uniref:DMT family transporter n=1 Tax=Leucobacter sp. Z1108 TaxID=3439066 RepID=UPI003F3F1D21